MQFLYSFCRLKDKIIPKITFLDISCFFSRCKIRVSSGDMILSVLVQVESDNFKDHIVQIGHPAIFTFTSQETNGLGSQIQLWNSPNEETSNAFVLTIPSVPVRDTLNALEYVRNIT